MDVGDQFVGVGGDDREGPNPLTCSLLFPVLPNAGKTEWRSVFHRNRVGLCRRGRRRLVARSSRNLFFAFRNADYANTGGLVSEAGLFLDFLSLLFFRNCRLTEQPDHGEQEMSVWNGHYQCTCYHPLFVFNQFGDLERCVLRPGNVYSADGWESVLKPVIVRLPANQVLQNRIAYLLKRPLGRPPNQVRRYYANFTRRPAGPSRAG
jgi:Transposase DDE domain group 1